MEQSIYKYHIDPDPEVGIEIECLGTVKAMIDHYYSDLPIKQARTEVEKLIGGWCTGTTWYEVSKPCLACGQHPTKPIVLAGELKADYYCDKCRPAEVTKV